MENKYMTVTCKRKDGKLFALCSKFNKRSTGEEIVQSLERMVKSKGRTEGEFYEGFHIEISDSRDKTTHQTLQEIHKYFE